MWRSAVSSKRVEHVSNSTSRTRSSSVEINVSNISLPSRWSGTYERSHDEVQVKKNAGITHHLQQRSTNNPRISKSGAPQKVTAEVLRCQTVQELHECLMRNQLLANGITLAAAMTHLAKLTGRLERKSAVYSKDGVEDALLEAENVLSLAVELLQPMLTSLSARGYANCIWACSKCWALDSRPAKEGGGALRLVASNIASDLADAFLDNDMAMLANGESYSLTTCLFLTCS